MTVQECIDFLMEVENKDLDLFVMGIGGLYTVCYEESGVCEDEDGEMFTLMPCYGHGGTVEVEVRPDEFAIIQN